MPVRRPSGEDVQCTSPKPLPAFLIGAALMPPLLVGAILHWHRYLSGTTKPFSQWDENVLKQSSGTVPASSNAGFGHDGIDPKSVLPRISQKRSRRDAETRSTPMTEIVAALLVGFSISRVLLHAVDA